MSKKKRDRQSASQAPARHSGEGRNPVTGVINRSTTAHDPIDNNLSPSLPKGWHRTTLGAVCSKPQYGWTTSAVKSGDVKLLRTTDITHGPIDWNDVPFCRDAPQDIEKYLLEEGDIVVSRAGSVGFSARVVAPERAVFASYLIRFRPKAEIDGKYLAYFLQSPTYWAQVRGNTAGIAVPNVNASKLEAFAIPLAPVDQQNAIVAEIEKQFTRLDAGVAALRRVQANLKRYRAAVLKAACEGRLVPTDAELGRAEGRSYETAEQLLARILADRRKNWRGRGKYKEPAALDTTNLPPLPEGWAWTNIEQLRVFSLYGPRFSSNDYAKDGYVVLRTTDISDSGKVDTTNAPRLRLSADDFAKYRTKRGDLLVTRTGSLGTLAIFDDEVEAIPGAYLILFRLATKPVTTRYLFYFLKSPTAQHYLTGKGAGVGRPNLNAPTIEDLPVPLPPIAEQERIVAEVERRLSVIEELEATVADDFQRAARLRQSILQHAFREETGTKSY